MTATALDTFLSEVDQRAAARSRADKAADTAAIVGRRTPAHTEPPLALVLVVHVLKCRSCGREHRAPQASCLVRYDRLGLSNSVHYSPTELTLLPQYSELPRERVEHHGAVPFCEQCFGQCDTFRRV